MDGLKELEKNSDKVKDCELRLMALPTFWIWRGSPYRGAVHSKRWEKVEVKVCVVVYVRSLLQHLTDSYMQV